MHPKEYLVVLSPVKTKLSNQYARKGCGTILRGLPTGCSEFSEGIPFLSKEVCDIIKGLNKLR